MNAPQLTIVVAMTAERVIGRSGRLPWHLPEELRLFRELTWGGTVIMGRGTFASLPAPLPGRNNLVVSTTLSSAPGICIVPNLPAALTEAAVRQRPTFVIGGAHLYRQALPLAAELRISWIETAHLGDTYFPPVFARDWSLANQRAYTGFCHAHYHKRKGPDASLEESGPELQPPA